MCEDSWMGFQYGRSALIKAILKKTIKNKILIPVVVALLVLNGYSGPALSDAPVTTVRQTPASRIVDQTRYILSNLKSTRYSHKTKIDEQFGIYITDCSALVCHVLEKVAPVSLAVVTVDPNHRYARAKNFFDAFQNAPIKGAQGGWQRIERLMDAKPGDIIAWRKDPMPPKGNTGHVVVLMEMPIKARNGVVRVTVMDASKSGHGCDTRKKGESGVGLGTMWFRIDDDGAPTALHWSSLKRKPKKYPIAIGRAVTVLPP